MTSNFPEVAETLAMTCGQAFCHGDNHNGNFHIEGGTDAAPAAVQDALENVETVQGTALISPGKPSESALYQRITGDGNLMPPPPSPDPPLSQEQIDTIRAWIVEGAPYE